MSRAPLDRHEAEEFLYTEARLLDEDRLEEWLELFTADGVYWVPSDEHADPEEETSIIHDDAEQRARRIYQLRHDHLSQVPYSRMVHFISNVEVAAGSDENEAGIHCSLLVFEMRPGDHQRLQAGLAEPRALAARCYYRLRREAAGWRMALKQVNLIDRDLPQRNMTFIL